MDLLQLPLEYAGVADELACAFDIAYDSLAGLRTHLGLHGFTCLDVFLFPGELDLLFLSKLRLSHSLKLVERVLC